MTYTSGMPFDGQSLGSSKPQVRGNFTTIFNAFAVNHVALDSLPQGIHTKVDLLNGSDNVSPANCDTLYSKISNSIGELFYIRPGGSPIQMTNNNPTALGTIPGCTFLPGGLLLQFGFFKIAANNTPETVTFALPFTVDGSGVGVFPYSITCSLGNSPSFGIPSIVGVVNATVTNTTFQVDNNFGAGFFVYWMAIGPKT